MNQVQLTAINPENSSVVPVACNDSGMIKVEPPQVVEGPRGPEGPEGPEGPAGQDGDSFVPDPSTGVAGSSLFTNGINAFWQLPPLPPPPLWSAYLTTDGSFLGGGVEAAFDGDTGTYGRSYSANNKRWNVYLTFPYDVAIASFEVFIGGWQGMTEAKAYGWGIEQPITTNDTGRYFHLNRFAGVEAKAGDKLTFEFFYDFSPSYGMHKADFNAFKLNSEVLLDPGLLQSIVDASVQKEVKRIRAAIAEKKG